MKSFTRRAAAAALVLLLTFLVCPPAGGVAASKKGVSVNTVAGVNEALRDVRAGWFYNWAADLQGVAKPEGPEFVPMIWGSGAVTLEQLAKANAAARGLRVDFIPLHWYGSDFSAAAVDHLRGYLQAVHNRYGKPIWLTEYALIDFTQDTPRYPTQEQQVAFVKNSSAMLQSLPFVERYAWFTLSTATVPTGLYDGATANASGQAYRSAG